MAPPNNRLQSLLSYDAGIDTMDEDEQLHNHQVFVASNLEEGSSGIFMNDASSIMNTPSSAQRHQVHEVSASQLRQGIKRQLVEEEEEEEVQEDFAPIHYHTSLAPSQQRGLTVPVSPIFATSVRAQIRREDQQHLQSDLTPQQQEQQQQQQQQRKRLTARRTSTSTSTSTSSSRRTSNFLALLPPPPQLTQPQAFRFRTDDRLQQKKLIAQQEEEEEEEEAQQQEEGEQLDLQRFRDASGLTVPQGFSFRSEQRAMMRNLTTMMSKQQQEEEEYEKKQLEQPKQKRTRRDSEQLPNIHSISSSSSKPRTLRHRNSRASRTAGSSFSSSSSSSSIPSSSGPGLAFSFSAPQPFHFRVDERAQVKKEIEEQAKEAASASSSSFSSSGVPISGPPQFITEERLAQRRAMREPVKSTLEREEEEAKSFPKFKALPLDERIINATAGDFGVPRVEKRPVTVPQGPNFALESRISARQQQQQQEQEEEEKSRKRILKRRAPVRTEESFDQEEEQEEQEGRAGGGEKRRRGHRSSFSVSPSPPISTPWQPRLTEPQPFNLATEMRGAQHEELQTHKLHQEKEEAERRRLFKARPYPEGLMEEPAFVVDYNKARNPVEPQPFPLRVAYRPPEDLSHLNPKPKPFQARPFNKEVEPFVPKVSERPLTAISDVQLNSDIRAVKRQAFDKEKAEKEAAAQAALAILRKQQEAEEQQEIKEMRKQMVVKARPVPNYNFFEPKPSPAALTQPASPMLLTKRREVQVQSRRTSHQQQQSVHRNNRNNGRSVMRDI